jgi:hypothetical protein
MASMLAAVGWMMLSTIFFTIIGWMSPFFIIALVVLALLGVVLMQVLNSGG